MQQTVFSTARLAYEFKESRRKQQRGVVARMPNLESAEMCSHCRGRHSDRGSRYALRNGCPAAQSAMPKSAREACGRFTNESSDDNILAR